MAEILRTGIDIAHRQLVHPYLTRGDAQKDREIAHDRSVDYAEKLKKYPALLPLLRFMFAYQDPILETHFGKEELGGLVMSNPLSLEAGFDKRSVMYHQLAEVIGLGAIKTGTTTKIEWKGNDRSLEDPRIVDLPESNSMWNSLGFPGDGSRKAVERFTENKDKKRHYALIANVGASKPSFDRGTQIQDTIDVATEVKDLVDAIEYNESSPNTEGVRDMSKPDNFREIVQRAQEAGVRSDGTRIGSIHKLPPNIPVRDLAEDIKIAIDHGALGLTIGNTTTDQEIRDRILPVKLRQKGGISGEAVKRQAMETARIARSIAGSDLGIWYVGGLENWKDAWDAVTYAGADAFGFLTGLVKKNTSTPNFAYYILHDFARAMRADGMTSMEEFKDIRGNYKQYPKI